MNTRFSCYIDLDGVIADFVGSAKDYCAEEFGVYISDNWIDSEFDEEFYFNLILNKTFYEKIKPFPEASLELSRLIENFDIIILTGRPIPIGITVSWCLKHKIPFTNILHRNKKERISLCKADNPFMLVEDNADTAKKCSEFCENTYLLARPWSDFRISGIKTIKDLSEICLT